MSRLETPTETKGGPFIPVGGSNRDNRLRGPFVPVGAINRDKRPLSPPLARLAVGPGTKATYCLGPQGCRDKWPGTKACFVVVIKTKRYKRLLLIKHVKISKRLSSKSIKSS